MDFEADPDCESLLLVFEHLFKDKYNSLLNEIVSCIIRKMEMSHLINKLMNEVLSFLLIPVHLTNLCGSCFLSFPHMHCITETAYN